MQKYLFFFKDYILWQLDAGWGTAYQPFLHLGYLGIWKFQWSIKKEVEIPGVFRKTRGISLGFGKKLSKGWGEDIEFPGVERIIEGIAN